MRVKSKPELMKFLKVKETGKRREDRLTRVNKKNALRSEEDVKRRAKKTIPRVKCKVEEHPEELLRVKRKREDGGRHSDKGKLKEREKLRRKKQGKVKRYEDK